MRALVLEPSPALGRVLCAHLRELGADPHLATCEEGARELLEAGEPFDLALVAWSPPSGRGPGELELLRALPGGSGARVVLVGIDRALADAAEQGVGAEGRLRLPSDRAALHAELDRLGLLVRAA